MVFVRLLSAAGALASPARFQAFAGQVLPWLWTAAAATLAAGLWLSFRAPPDYQQGETVRIMYVHVPCAWLGMAAYVAMAVSALGTLVWRHPMADVAARATAPLGAAFTLLALVTGSLWGKPMWGTYWVWDARLTSMLVLLLLYLGLMALWAAFEDPARAARPVAVLILVGAINIPVIKFSVDWWNTLHQPASLLRRGGPAIDPAILVPLLVMAAGFTLLFLALQLMAMRNEILRRRIRALSLRVAARPARGVVASPAPGPLP